MEEKQIKELMFNAFKKGQEKYEAEDYPIKLWIEGVIENAQRKK